MYFEIETRAFMKWLERRIEDAQENREFTDDMIIGYIRAINDVMDFVNGR